MLLHVKTSCRTLCSSSSKSPTDGETIIAPKGSVMRTSVVHKKTEWRPSEVHRVAATSIHRKEVRAGSCRMLG